MAEVKVRQGVIRGRERDGVFSFLGVPYAAAPFGALRMKPPAPAPLSAPATEFSAQRAMADVAAIASVPHPLGTAAHDASRDAVVRRMTALGLDPQVRQELWSLIDGLRAGGVTLLMSTHYIEEAERLADVVAVMSHGRIVAQGTPAELIRAHAGEQVVEVYGPPAKLAETSELVTRHGWQSRRSGPALAIMHAETLDGEAPEGVRRPANLEDAFVALTGEEIE